MGEQAYEAWSALRVRIGIFQETYGGALYSGEIAASGDDEPLVVEGYDDLLEAVGDLRRQCQLDLTRAETNAQFDQANAQMIASASVSLMLASDMYALESSDLGVADPSLPGMPSGYFWDYRRMTARDLVERAERLFREEDGGGGSPAPLVPLPPLPGESGPDAPPAPAEVMRRTRQAILRELAAERGKPRFEDDDPLLDFPWAGGQHLSPQKEAQRGEALACADAMLNTCGKGVVNLARGAVGDAYDLGTIDLLDRAGIPFETNLELFMEQSEAGEKALPFLENAAKQLADMLVDGFIGKVLRSRVVKRIRAALDRGRWILVKGIGRLVGYKRFESQLSVVLVRLDEDWDERESCRTRLDQLEADYEELNEWAGFCQPWLAMIAGAGTILVSAGISVAGAAVLCGLLSDRLDTMPARFPGVDGITRIIESS